MSLDRQPERSALDAIEETIRLLNQADRSLDEARGTFTGDVCALATRMSRQLCFLSEVAELLYHELARKPGLPGARVIPFPRKELPFKSR